MWQAFSLYVQSEEHMMTHTKVYPFKCDVCERKFRRNSELKQHKCHGQGTEKKKIARETKESEKMKEHVDNILKMEESETHQPDVNGDIDVHGNTICKMDGKRTLKSSSKSCSTSKIRRHGCNLCGKRFIQKCHLKEHMMSHTKIYPFKCDVCERKFKRNSGLKQHKCLGQGTESEKIARGTKESEKMKERVDNILTTEESETHQPDVKGVLHLHGSSLSKTEVQTTFKQHKCLGEEKRNDIVEFISCNICNKTVRKKWIQMHRRRHAKKHVCKVCKKRYLTPGNLKEHMNIHTGERPFLCDKCGKSFPSQAGIVNHRAVHYIDRPFACTICHMTFKKKQHLKSHIITHQPKERKYLCHVCGKDFYAKTSLQSHIRMHKEVKKYVCIVCGAAFRTSTHLNSHKFRHSREKTVKCELCDYRCVHNGYLKAHMRSHSDNKPYKCVDCEQTFKRLENLKVHARIHSGYKPFKCDVCDAAFTHYAGLYLHTKRHKHTM